jgi:F-type H+-transporting ATPase subunit gamma
VAGLKEIRRRITSVKNTRQITRAMKLVSAAKLRKAQEAAIAGRQFGSEIKKALMLAIENLPEGFTHPYLTKGGAQITSPKAGTAENSKKKRRVIVVGGERGLCGAFNANLIKAVQLQENPADCDFVLVGRKACSTGRRFNWNPAEGVTASDANRIGFEGLTEDVSQWPIDEIITATTADFINGQVEDVVIYYTKFVSAMTQKPVREVVLPLDFTAQESEAEVVTESLVAKLEPSPSQVFDYLLPVYLRSIIREAGLESRASEHAARMTAMESATNNASDLIERLRLFYNRARQSAITTELIDIIGGAGAVE